MSQVSRRTELILIPLALAAAAIAIWCFGAVADSNLVKFVGFMAGACTFVPLPADAYVLNVSADNPALVVGVLGGGVNAVAVLIERQWVLRFIDHPSFDRFKEFVGTNRWVELANKNLFIGLIIGGFSFLPFEPFRLVAILRNYSQERYAIATFLGRGFRYYWLARAGELFAGYGVIKYAVWASLAFFFVGLIRSYQKFSATQSQSGDLIEGQSTDE